MSRRRVRDRISSAGMRRGSIKHQIVNNEFSLNQNNMSSVVLTPVESLNSITKGPINNDSEAEGGLASKKFLLTDTTTEMVPNFRSNTTRNLTRPQSKTSKSKN